MHIFSFLLAVLSIGLAQAQAPTVQWQASIGGDDLDEVRSIAPTADGGYIVAGLSWSMPGHEKSLKPRGIDDGWLVKLDAKGQKQWDVNLGGLGGEMLKVVRPLPDGGYILAGSTDSEAEPNYKTDPARGEDDYWILKVDAQGNRLWDHSYGSDAEDVLVAMTPTPDGGYLLGGYSDGYASGDKSEDTRGDRDYWVVKVDAQGKKLWDRTLGSKEQDDLQALAAMPDGTLWVAGNSVGDAGGDRKLPARGGFDIWMVQLDAQGNTLREVVLGGTGDDEPAVLVPLPDGRLLVGGSVETGGMEPTAYRSVVDYYVACLSPDGKELWHYTAGGNKADYLTGLHPLPDGGFLLAGFAASTQLGQITHRNKGGHDCWAIRLDAKGKKLWDKGMGTTEDDYMLASCLGHDGGLLMAASSRGGAEEDKTSANKGQNDIWLLKLAP